MVSRRRFLQVGAAGVAVLVLARMLDRPEPALMRVLDRDGVALVRALVPVVLAGALPPAGTARDAAVSQVVDAFDRAVSGLSPAVRAEIGELLGVLHFAPSRVALTGLWHPVHEASSEEIAAFLARWRTSRFDLLRAGYQALTQLIQASWYDNPASWAAIGYPGPPALGPRA